PRGRLRALRGAPRRAPGGCASPARSRERPPLHLVGAVAQDAREKHRLAPRLCPSLEIHCSARHHVRRAARIRHQRPRTSRPDPGVGMFLARGFGMNPRISTLSIAALVAQSAATAMPTISHPETAYPDSLPPLVSPGGPFAHFIMAVQAHLHEAPF